MLPESERRETPAQITQEFAGYSAPLLYSNRDLEELSEYHTSLFGGLSEKPYYDFTDKGQEPIFSLNLGPMEMTVGRSGAFSKHEIGAWIQELAWNYVYQDTMGRGFPNGDLAAEQELLRIFMGGFSPEDLLIVVNYETQEGVKPIAGTRIVHGHGDRLVSVSAIENNSTIPTFQAVNLVRMNEGFDQKTLEVPEKNTVGITRYWAQKGEIAKLLEIDRCSTPADVIAVMPLAYVLAETTDGRSSNRELAVFDIHKKRTAEFVRDQFEARFVAQGENVVPTPQILDTILKYHYGPAEIGGYQGQIIVGAFDTRVFLEKSLEYFVKRKIDLPSLVSSINGKVKSEHSFPTL